MANTGEGLKLFLKKNSLTQSKLAKELGFSRRVVNQVANGAEPSARFILNFFYKFGTDATIEAFDAPLNHTGQR